MTDKLKYCASCLRNHPITAFSINRANNDGRQYVCKLAQARYYRSYYALNRENIIHKRLIYIKRHPKKHREYNTRHRAKMRAAKCRSPLPFSAIAAAAPLTLR